MKRKKMIMTGLLTLFIAGGAILLQSCGKITSAVVTAAAAVHTGRVTVHMTIL